MEKKLLNKLKKEHSTLQEQINALNKQMQETSKELMKEAFRDFFEKYQTIVENVYWTQYTPHFNDGEACEFGVNDVFILLKDDEESCDYEGSSVSDKEDIAKLKKTIAEIEAWEKDPMTAARKHQSEYIKKYNRDPFAADRNSYSSYSYGNKTPEEQMREWKPHYGTKEDYLEQLAFAENLISKYPDLKEDLGDVKAMVANIDENLMRAMFGDHVKVIVSKAGIEIEEYDHD
jgi:hypothetical protein